MGSLKASSGGALEFRYEEGWLADQRAFPMSLSLPLAEKSYKTDAILPFLDNLLPDNEGVRGAIAARVNARGADPFSLLWELGRDCVGALQFLPASEDPDWSAVPTGEELTEEQIARMLTSLSTSPLGMNRETTFRISVAGAQEKTALLLTVDGWQLPKGTTPSTHIIKPAIGMRDGIDLTHSVENEFLCMTIVSEIGFPAANVTMERFGEVKALVVERFDRMWVDESLLRLPQEDMCQAMSVPSFRKYDADGGPGMAEVLDLLLQSDAPEEDRKRFLQACYLYWLLGATDGHAKNFSIALAGQGRFRLAPVYDVMSLQPNVDLRQVQRRDYRLAMAVGTSRHYKMDEVLPRHFVQTADVAGTSDSAADAWIREIAEKLPAALERVQSATKDVIPERLFDSIAEGALRRAALLE